MRRTSKILAFVLAMLMIVGMLPVSVFAGDGSVTNNSEVLGNKEDKPTGENQTLKEYVESNGGTLVFGSSFDDASKILLNDTGRVNSSVGGSGYVHRANMTVGSGKVWLDVDAGALRLEAPADAGGDIWPAFQTNLGGKAVKNGQTLVLDFTVAFNKAFTSSIGFFYGVDDGPASGNGDRSDNRIADFVMTADGKVGIKPDGASKVITTFELGEKVNLSVLVDPVAAIAYFYKNGEYLGSNMIGMSKGNIYIDGTRTDVKYPSFDTVRFLQITSSKNVDIALYDMYAYMGVNAPYKTKGTPDIPLGLDSLGANVHFVEDFTRVDDEAKDEDGDGIFAFGGRKGGNLVNYKGKSYMQIVSRIDADGFKYMPDGFNTYFRYDDCAKGEHTYINIYLAGTYDINKANVFVMQFDLRGDIYGSQNLQLIDRSSGTFNDTIGYSSTEIKIGGTKVSGVATNEFSTVTLIVDTKTNKMAVAVDGIVYKKDVTYCADASKIKAVSELRFNLSTSNTKGYLDFDNFLIYSYNTPEGKSYANSFAGYVGDYDGKAKWEQNDEGYWRYRDANGYFASNGTQNIGGVTYRFNKDGYYSTPNRVSLVNLDAKNSDNSVFQTGNASYATTMRVGKKPDGTSWKYSALWTHSLYEGYKQDEEYPEAGPNSNPASPPLYGSVNQSTSVDIGASGAYMNPEVVRPTTEADIAGLSGWKADVAPESAKRVPGADKIIDMVGYDQLEIKYYAENLKQFYAKIILNSLDYDIRSATDYNRKAYWRDDKAMDFRSDEPVDGYKTISYEVSSLKKTIWRIQITSSWDPTQSRGDYSMSALYFLEFNLVKYEPVKSEVSPAERVRTDDNGNIVVYNGSVEANGWTVIGDDTYYCDTRGVAQIGVVKEAGKNYIFGADGKLIKAGGLQVVGDKMYYVDANGNVGIGSHEVNGVKFTTNALGEVTLKGELPYIKYNTYTPTDLTGKKVLLSTDFQNHTTENPPEGTKPTKGTSANGFADRNVPYVGAHWEDQTAKIIEGTQPANINFYGLVRQTRWYNVKEADGNVALLMYNMNIERDPYIDIDFNHADVRPTEFVVEASFKLGSDWNANAMLLSIQDRVTNGNKSFGLSINNEGYVYLTSSRGVDSIVAQLNPDEYTKISIAKVGSTGYVYVNDVQVVSWGLHADLKMLTKVRLCQFYSNNVGQGHMYVDNINVYEGKKTETAKNPYVNGAVQFGDFYRYFGGGCFVGNQWRVSDGDEYYYQHYNGLRYTETGFIDGFYLVDGAKQKFTGATTLPGTTDKYFFKDDFTVLAQKLDKYVDPNNSDYAYDIDETGKIVAEYYRGQILATENAGFADVVDPNGGVNAGDYVYDADAGKNVFVPKGGNFTLQNFGKLTDISDYSFLNLRMKSVNGAKYSIIFGYTLIQEIIGYEISGADYAPEQVIKADCTDIQLKDLTGVEGDVYKLVDGETTRYFKVTLFSFGETVEYTVSGDAWNEISIALSAYSPELLENVEFIALSIDSEVSIETATLIGYYEAGEGGTALEGWQGDRYYVDGFPAKGWLKLENRWYYFDPITGIKTTGLAKLPLKPADDVATIAEEETYYVFSEGGALQGVANGKVETTVYVYDDETKSFAATTVIRVFAEGVPVTDSYEDENGNKYYINNEDNSIITDSFIDTDNDGVGDTYLGDDGLPTVVANKWVQDGDSWSYIGANGEKVVGYVGIKTAPGSDEEGATKYYFFDEDGILVTNDFVDVNGTEVYMDKNGNPANGIVTDPDFGGQFGTMYFVNGMGCAAELIVDEDGTAYLYTFDADGVLANKQVISEDGPVVLVKIVKDGKSRTFVFELKNGTFDAYEFTVDEDGITYLNKVEMKSFEAYACYKIVIKNEITGDTVAEGEPNASLKFPADYTLAESTTYIVTYVPVEHDYQLNTELSIAAGCLTDGKNVYTCASCGNTYYEVAPATGLHVYDEDSALVVLKANCWRAGLTEYTCECGAVKTVEIEIDPDNHTNAVISYTDTNGDGVIDENDAETCTQGATIYLQCVDCHTFEYEDLDPIPHESDGKWFYENESDKPTCVSKGVATSYCKYGCGNKVTKDVKIDADYHLYADLLEKGLTVDNGVYAENRYDYHLEENTDENGKTEAELIAENFAVFQLIKNSDCTVNGIAVYRCLACGSFVDGAVPTNETYDGHVWDDGVVTEADQHKNCGEIVERVHKCIYGCLDENGEDVTYSTWDEANGNHSYNFDNWYTVSDPTDALYGYHFNLCEKCFKAINVTAHDFSDYECNDDGTHSRTCDCYEFTIVPNNDGVTSDIVPANGSYVLTENCVSGEFVSIDNATHGDKCKYCEGYFNVDEHNIVAAIVEGRHVHHCDACGFIAYDIDVDGREVDELEATCDDTGYTAHTQCTFNNCDYKTDDYQVLERLNHKYSDEYFSDGNTHWFQCELCEAKLFEKSHKWESVDALAAKCISDGYNAHERCEICKHVKEGSVTALDGSALKDEDAIIKAFGHQYSTTVYNDAVYHWQYCERIITLLDGSTVACTHIGVPDGDDDHKNDAPAKHTYENYNNKTGYEYEDYDDEFGTGFRYCDYEGCQHKEWSDDLPTWWSDLGLKLFVDENGNRRYYLEVEGVKVTDYVTELTDKHTGMSGVYYFDANGYLVLAGDWSEGEATNANPFTGAKDNDKFHTVKADNFALRGAISANVVITASNGTYKVECNPSSGSKYSELLTGWQEIEGKFYFFYDPAIEEITGEAMGGYNGEYLATAKGKMLTGATIYAYAYDKYTKTYVDDQLILCNLNEEGAHLLGIVMDGEDAYFYLDGYVGKMTGRIEDSYWCANDSNYNDIYFARSNGKLYSGKHVSVDGVYYSFGGDRFNMVDSSTTVVGDYVMSEWHAHQILDFYVDADGVRNDVLVYTDGEGKIIETGWFRQEGAGGSYIYEGEMVTDAEAYEVNGYWYDIDADGVAANRTGWIKIDTYDAYVVESVLMVSKFVLIGENQYYFDSDGYLLKAEAGSILDVYIGTTPYEIDENGVAVARTLKDHWVRFLDKNGKLSESVGYFFHTTGLARGLYVGTIDNATYYFDANGVMQKDYKYYDAINDKYYMFNAAGVGTEVSKEEYEEDEIV